MEKTLTLSIVIPVFNEEDYLGACLESIAAQTEAPDEVIVVDNNSTDKSAGVAAGYKFVKVVKEKRQGRSFAQNRGFNLATGDILGRIDADTHLDKDWVARVKEAMADRPEAAAVTGEAIFYDFPLPRFSSAVHSLFYRYSQKLITGQEMLWGANMAIRKDAWRKLRPLCNFDNRYDEDIGMSLLMINLGLKVKRTRGMKAAVSMRRGDLGFRSTVVYLSTWARTYWFVGRHLQAVFIYILKSLIIVLGIPFYIRNAWEHQRHHSLPQPSAHDISRI